MTGPLTGDTQVMALFGHVLTPPPGQTAAAQEAQQMEVDTTRKRQRQSKQQPAHKGNGKGGGKAREDKNPGRSNNSSDKDLLQALSRVVLQQADQLHRLECDTGFFLVLATAPAAGTVIPTMFNVAELWRKQQAESPELLTCSLGIMMFRCLLQELNNRLCLALKSKEVLDGLAKQEMITDKQDWRYMTWDKDNGKLVPDGTRSPMTTKDLQKSLQEAANLLQNSPEMITRFCSTQKLLPETTNAMNPLPDRCHAEGRSHVPDSASMVPAECLASAERALAPGSGQAYTYRDQDSESAQSYVLGLQLRNDANQCYANSLVLALAWTVQRHGAPTAVSLQALLLKLQRARAGQPLMLRKLQEWRPFAQGWLRPLQQHDVAELFMHMCKRAQGFPDCCRWTVQRVAAGGVPAEPGGDGPILMQLRHTNGTAHATLQDCFEGWHEQLHLYAIDGARPMLVVQLSRFVGHGVFCTKDTAEISLGSGVVTCAMHCCAGCHACSVQSCGCYHTHWSVAYVRTLQGCSSQPGQ